MGTVVAGGEALDKVEDLRGRKGKGLQWCGDREEKGGFRESVWTRKDDKKKQTKTKKVEKLVEEEDNPTQSGNKGGKSY